MHKPSAFAFARALRAIAALACLALSAACAPQPGALTQETEETAYRRAKSFMRENRPREALAQYLKVIDMRAQAPESHLEAGAIYLDHVKDPIAAIHHFRQYLQDSEDDANRDLVEQLIETAEKEFAKSLPGKPFGSGNDRAEALAAMERLQVENLDLKRQIARQRTQLEQTLKRLNEARKLANMQPVRLPENGEDEAASTAAAETEPEEPDHPAVYEVQSGDTLSGISQKMYGTQGRWMDIYQANRDTLSAPHALKPGQTLRIP